MRTESLHVEVYDRYRDDGSFIQEKKDVLKGIVTFDRKITSFRQSENITTLYG